MYTFKSNKIFFLCIRIFLTLQYTTSLGIKLYTKRDLRGYINTQPFSEVKVINYNSHGKNYSQDSPEVVRFQIPSTFPGSLKFNQNFKWGLRTTEAHSFHTHIGFSNSKCPLGEQKLFEWNLYSLFNWRKCEIPVERNSEFVKPHLINYI